MFSSLSLVFPIDIGAIHFIGIGGIGMSGIAEILHSLGYKIQGSDKSQSYVTERLASLGITIYGKHESNNISSNVAIVVKSTAIGEDNPEIIQARKNNIPVISRSEMLAEIMRFKHSIAVSGTHGKTTTTSLVAALLENAGIYPTVINGGIINNKGTNAYIGQSRYLVAEADESDGTFIKVPSYIAVITNIDPEHLDYYGTFENAISAYRSFVQNLPFYGFGVLCYDHPIVKQLGRSIKSRKVISYGIDEESVDFKVSNIQYLDNGSCFDIHIAPEYVKHKNLSFSKIEGINLNMHGKHNISNATAAIAIGVEIGIDKDKIATAFAHIAGVKRRFIKVGEIDGISIIDDYAHHPVEIMATLNTAKIITSRKNSKSIAIVQPHRYSRLQDLMEEFALCFKEADYVLITDVYSAGEAPIPGVNSEVLAAKAGKYMQNVQYVSNIEMLPSIIKNIANNGDLVVFLGAGNITKWAYDMTKQLKELSV
jgi:UDP-N-acetylmuramate--alanine ligase